MKQTAVEYLIEHLKEMYYLTEETLYEFEAAKRMEKQQIIDAHNNGKNILPPNNNGEQYYNDSFKK